MLFLSCITVCKPDTDSKAKEAEVTEVTSVICVETEKTPAEKEPKLSDRSTGPSTTILKNESDFIAGLESKEFDQGPTIDLTLRATPRSGATCSTCKAIKPAHQAWQEHNLTEDHIKALISAGGSNSAVQYLDKEYKKYLPIKSEHCHTYYSNTLLYSVPKGDPEHIRRKSEQLRLVHLASQKGSVNRWHTNVKPPKISAKYIGKTLSHYKKYSKRA